MVVTLFGSGVVVAEPLTARDLQGNWSLIEIDSRPVPVPSPTAGNALPHFTIKGQSIQGFDGCNDFSGLLDKPGSIGSTRRGCLEEALKLPLDLSDPMPQLKAGKIEKGRLVLPPSGTMPESAFQKIS
jgi:heat shock protein HslJ